MPPAAPLRKRRLFQKTCSGVAWLSGISQLRLFLISIRFSRAIATSTRIHFGNRAFAPEFPSVMQTDDKMWRVGGVLAMLRRTLTCILTGS